VRNAAMVFEQRPAVAKEKRHKISIRDIGGY
jgi:hypothetical protein